jgi:hypothetical protein
MAQAKETIEEQVQQRLQDERSQISAAEAKKAQAAVAADLQASQERLAELQEILKQNDVRLAESRSD